MTNRRYFVNLKTGGHMILDASMGNRKDTLFVEIACQHGFEEVTRERYRRLQSQGKIGEGANEP